LTRAVLCRLLKRTLCSTNPQKGDMNEVVRELTASPAAELREQNRVLVTTVARAYKQAKGLPLLCATDYDPAPVTQSRKWTPQSCEFCIDVENAIRKITGNKPDADVLLEAWNRLQKDDAVIGKDGARLIRLAAPIFNARGLHPAKYFRIIRHGSASARRPA